MSSKNRISLTPEQLRTQCKVYGRTAGDIEAARDRVDAMNTQMSQHWNGSAYESYIDQYDDLCKHVDDFCQLCRDVETQLTSYANAVEQADEDKSKSFGFGSE